MPNALERAMYGVVSTPVLQLADRYGIFSHLIDHGSQAPAEMADVLGVDGETLERVLLVLTAFDVLRRTPEGRYEVPGEVRPYLDRNDDQYVGGFVGHLVSETSTQINRLAAYLERGKTAVDVELPTPFETFYRDEKALGEFMAAMWSLSFAPSKELAELAGLDEVRSLIDVGGASGPFAVAALLRSPTLRATVFDLPPVEPFVAESRRAYDLADRLDFVPGDFFADELPGGDCIALGYVLSDWTDRTCTDLLAKAYRACATQGRVLVMERLFNDSRDGPLATSVMNLTMHIETQGRHRTAAEYLALLADAGFRDCAVHRSSGDKHLIIGYKR